MALADTPPRRVLNALVEGLSPYFLILAPWARRETPEWLLRLPSALVGVGLALSCGALGRVLGSSRLARRLALAAAVSPFLVWHSREARWYPITWLLVTLGALCFLRTLSSGSVGWLIGCALMGLAAGTTFAPAIIVLGIQLASLVASRRWRQMLLDARTRLALTERLIQAMLGAVVLAAIIVWVGKTLVAPAVRGGASGFGFHHLGGPTLGAVAYTAVAFATGYTLGPGPSEWHTLTPVDMRPLEIAMLGLGVVVLLVLGVGGCVALARARGSFLASALTAQAILPPVLVILACWWSDHAYAPRHAGISYPVTLALVLHALQPEGLRRRKLRIIFFGMLVILQMVSLWNLFANPRYQREDVRDAARYVASQAPGPGTVVLVFGGIEEPWAHYYRGSSRWRMIDATGSGAWSQEKLQTFLDSQESVWAVRGRLWEEPGSENLVRVVEGWAPASERREFPGAVFVSWHERPVKFAGPPHDRE